VHKLVTLAWPYFSSAHQFKVNINYILTGKTISLVLKNPKISFPQRQKSNTALGGDKNHDTKN